MAFSGETLTLTPEDSGTYPSGYSCSISDSPTSVFDDAYEKLRAMFAQQLMNGLFTIFLTEKHIILERMDSRFDKVPPSTDGGTSSNQPENPSSNNGSVENFGGNADPDDDDDGDMDDSHKPTPKNLSEGLRDDDDDQTKRGVILIDCEISASQNEGPGPLLHPRVKLTRLEDLGYSCFGYSAVVKDLDRTDCNFSTPLSDSVVIDVVGDVQDSMTVASSLVVEGKGLESLTSIESNATVGLPSSSAPTDGDDEEEDSCAILNSSLTHRKMSHVTDLRTIHVDREDEEEPILDLSNYKTGNDNDLVVIEEFVDESQDYSYYNFGEENNDESGRDQPPSDGNHVLEHTLENAQRIDLHVPQKTPDGVSSTTSSPNSCCSLKRKTISYIDYEAKAKRARLTQISKSRGVSCFLCGLFLRNMRDLLTHRTKVHSIQRSVRCGLCPTVYETKRDLSSHLNKIHNLLRCRECRTLGKRRWLSVSQLGSHIMKEHRQRAESVSISSLEKGQGEALDGVPVDVKDPSSTNLQPNLISTFTLDADGSEGEEHTEKMVRVEAKGRKLLGNENGDKEKFELVIQREICSSSGKLLTPREGSDREPARFSGNVRKFESDINREGGTVGPHPFTEPVVDPDQDHFLSFLDLKPLSTENVQSTTSQRRVLRGTKSSPPPAPNIDVVDVKPDILSPEEMCKLALEPDSAQPNLACRSLDTQVSAGECATSKLVDSEHRELFSDVSTVSSIVASTAEKSASDLASATSSAGSRSSFTLLKMRSSSKGRTIFSCPDCNLAFHNIRTVEKHVLKRHRKRQHAYLCRLCRRFFSKAAKTWHHCVRQNDLMGKKKSGVSCFSIPAESIIERSSLDRPLSSDSLTESSATSASILRDCRLLDDSSASMNSSFSPATTKENLPYQSMKVEVTSPGVQPLTSSPPSRRAPNNRSNAPTTRSNTPIRIKVNELFSPIVRVRVPRLEASGKRNRTMYECQFCGRLLWKKTELAAHVVDRHSDQKLISLCLSCNHFYDPNVVQNHVKQCQDKSS